MSTETEDFNNIGDFINIKMKMKEGKKAAKKFIKARKKAERAEAKEARKAKRAAFCKKVKAKANNNKVKSSVIGLGACFIIGVLYGVFK
jgi:hypothetical protein